MALTALANPLGHTPLQLMAGWLPSGLISTDSLQDIVRRAVAGAWVEHPNYWAVACDYGSGRRVPFGRLDSPNAEIAEAVAASCAIPGFYRPVKIGGRRYVDGGVCSASNLDLLAGRGLDLVVCLNPLSSGTELGQPDGDAAGRSTASRARPARLARHAQPPGQRTPARARGREGARLRHRGAPGRADLRGPRGDGPQPDERQPERRQQVIETAAPHRRASSCAGPSVRELLRDLPPASRTRSAGPPGRRPAGRSSARRRSRGERAKAA